MELQQISGEFTICKVTNFEEINLEQDYVFTAKTDKEYSVICPTRLAPTKCIEVEDHWKCFRIAEDASFGKYGMIAFLADIIAKQKTGILVVATYDTDYILIKEDKMNEVKLALINAGCHFIDGV